MVTIERVEVTDEMARYQFFPENSEKSGIVVLNRSTGERVLEKEVDGYGNNYAAHAIRRIEEYQQNGNFLEKDVVVWY